MQPGSAGRPVFCPNGLTTLFKHHTARCRLSTHPVSALLDCSTTVTPTVAVFGAEQETPASLFRLGATPAVARAPRLPAEALLEVSSADERSGCAANLSEVRVGKTDE